MTLEAAETQRTMDELEAQIYARVLAGEDGTGLN
jgi:hypothetical protein